MRTSTPGGRPAVFLDRDGTITVERGYITRPEDLELIEGSGSAVRALNEAGILAVLVSNQSGVARGLMTEEDLASVHRALEGLLASHQARLDAAYYCPNLRDGRVERFARDSSCRKPETGMLDLAVRDLGVDIDSSFMVGDQLTDVELAERAGMPMLVVLTGKGRETAEAAAEKGLAVAAKVKDVASAVEWILQKRGRQAKGRVP
jgi:D-glycero-D-manno-heptose 1,7-bisphosphate phosphatase